MPSKSKHTEYKFQVAVCNYLNYQYPDVVFLSDTIANVKLTQAQAGINKKIQKADFSCPDILILEPNKKYHGLFLELKSSSPYTLEGTLKKQKVVRKNNKGMVVDVFDHLKEQERSLRVLRSKGYYADFCWDIDSAIKIIKEYMNNR